jgi:hypothetical protein
MEIYSFYFYYLLFFLSRNSNLSLILAPWLEIISQKPLNLRHCYHELQRTNELYALNNQRPCVKHASVLPLALIIHLFPIAFLTPILVMMQVH